MPSGAFQAFSEQHFLWIHFQTICVINLEFFQVNQIWLEAFDELTWYDFTVIDK